MDLTLELTRESDEHWKAEISGMPGCAAHGPTPAQAAANAKILALRVLAERLRKDCSFSLNRISFTERMLSVAA